MKIRSAAVFGLAMSIIGMSMQAQAFRQFPYDIPGIVDWNNDGPATGTVPSFVGLPAVPVAVSKHLSAGDGYSKMADGKGLYIFGFADGSAFGPGMFMDQMIFKADFPAPTIDYYEGQEFYLTLTNVGMKKRPDLFDPHTVHFHGFPQAAPVFDGEPMASFGIRMGYDLTYYYNLVEPGTYLYHCHVEATEHMEMGMLGNLAVRPRQDLYVQKNAPATIPAVLRNGRPYNKFAYNDCDNVPDLDKTQRDFTVNGIVTDNLPLTGSMCGSTGYDVDKLIQFSEFDPVFHDLHINAQPLPFANLEAKYFMLNGRGYPETLITGGVRNDADEVGEAPYTGQKLDSLVSVSRPQSILLRLSNLSIQNFATLEFNGLPFKVVGRDARLLRGPDGKDLSYYANSVFIGPGQTFDLLIETADLEPGRYFFFSRNLNQLNNDLMERGGAMTEIVVN